MCFFDERKRLRKTVFEELGLLTRSALFFWELKTLLHCKDLSFLLQPQSSSYNNRLVVFFFLDTKVMNIVL